MAAASRGFLVLTVLQMSAAYLTVLLIALAALLAEMILPVGIFGTVTMLAMPVISSTDQTQAAVFTQHVDITAFTAARTDVIAVLGIIRTHIVNSAMILPGAVAAISAVCADGIVSGTLAALCAQMLFVI